MNKRSIARCMRSFWKEIFFLSVFSPHSLFAWVFSTFYLVFRRRAMFCIHQMYGANCESGWIFFHDLAFATIVLIEKSFLFGAIFNQFDHWPNRCVIHSNLIWMEKKWNIAYARAHLSMTSCHFYFDAGCNWLPIEICFAMQQKIQNVCEFQPKFPFLDAFIAQCVIDSL